MSGGILIYSQVVGAAFKHVVETNVYKVFVVSFLMTFASLGSASLRHIGLSATSCRPTYSSVICRLWILQVLIRLSWNNLIFSYRIYRHGTYSTVIIMNHLPSDLKLWIVNGLTLCRITIECLICKIVCLCAMFCLAALYACTYKKNITSLYLHIVCRILLANIFHNTNMLLD